MAAKIKRWFNGWLKAVEDAGMARARRHLEVYGWRKWE